MADKKKKRELSPIHGQFPSDDIICKDCMFRDHETVEIGSKVLPVGVKRAHCMIYTDTAGKPTEILFAGADCAFYEKET